VRLYGAAVVGRSLQDRSKYNDSAQASCRALRESVPDLNADGTVDSCPREPDKEKINQRGLDVGIVGRIAPSTITDIKVGYLHWDFEDETSKPFDGVALTGRLEHTFNRRTRATLDLGHTPLQASGQITGYYVRTDGTLGLERSLTQQLYMKAALAVRNYDYSGSNFSSQPFSFIDYVGDLQLRYRPGSEQRPGPMLLTLAYAPLVRHADSPTLEYKSQRVVLSLLYGWF
jgi:hypothetical protein